MKRILAPTLILLLLAFATTNTNAQDKISPEKRALIAEYISLTKLEKLSNEMIDNMLAATEASYPITVKEALDRQPDLSPSERAQREKEMLARTQSVSKKYRERWPKYINLKEYIEATVYQLYDKYYTEDDLRAINAFYRTPAGQKMLEVAPKIVGDSMRKALEMLMPQVKNLVDDILKEEIDAAKKPVLQTY